MSQYRAGLRGPGTGRQLLQIDVDVQVGVGLTAGGGERRQGPHQPVALRRRHLLHDGGDFGTPVRGDLTDDLAPTLGQRSEQFAPRGRVR